MKRGFIRGLWGVFDNTHRVLSRRFRLDAEINTIVKCKFNQPFTTYVMGEENNKILVDTGLEKLGHTITMLTKEPQMFDLIAHQYRNKMEVIRYAMEVDGFDEVVYLDWDCVPLKPLPDNFWEEQAKKEPFQACLQRYKHPPCAWRRGCSDDESTHKVPNGGYLYFRDKTYPSKAIKVWEDEVGKPMNDELAWAKFTDNMFGGWKSDDFYFEKFETMFCYLSRMSPLSQERVHSKNLAFVHYPG